MNSLQQLSYHEFPASEQEALQRAQRSGVGEAAAEAAAGPSAGPRVHRLLAGGVLYVRVVCASDLDFSKKPLAYGGFKRRVKAKVTFAGETKSSVVLAGRRANYNFDSELEFVVS
jgi:hypothetical protein